jgi:nucleoside-diphosphate-sugar epimerase
VFGPRQDPTSQYSAVIPKFIQAMLRGDAPTVYGDGTQSRDFTFVSNVVEANLLAATDKARSGEVYNCATHGQITLNEVVDHLNDILGTRIAARYVDPRPGDIRHSYADIAAFSRAVGFRPAVSFEEGLHRTVEWNRAYHLEAK